MNYLVMEEKERLELAFGANRLLATFPEELREALRDHAHLEPLEAGETVFRRGVEINQSIFPIGPTVISLIIDMEDGRSVEVASIGQEGAAGGIVSCGHAPAFTRAAVVVGGQGLKVPMKIIEQAKSGSGHLRNIFCRYSDYLLAQVMQTVGCIGFHPIEARAARWLLTAQDRAGSRLELTQEALAALLGVQRTTVNAVAKQLQDEGMISTRRGVVLILDRPALERRACECYERVETFFGDIIGEAGSGRAV